MAFKNDFRPDVIAGNVPYSDGSDIDFIYDAYKVARYGICEITPAKCFVADKTQKITSEHSYKNFQEQIAPTIDKVIFYPDAAEIFEIRNTDGITIYTCNKSKQQNEDCTVINRNLHQKYFNSTETRNITNRETLHNCGYRLIQQLSNYEKFTFQNITNTKKYQVWTGNKVHGGCGWGFSNRKDPCSTFNQQGKMKCVGSSIIVNKENNEVDTRTSGTCTFESDSLEECKSFISWLDTKLVRFLVCMNISKLTGILTDDYFRFVPKPFKQFTNGLYTDEEMYTQYNIDQNTINIIESIISER
jgi:hypothetical protein